MAGDQGDIQALFVADQVIRQVAENEDLWEAHGLDWLDSEAREDPVRDMIVDLIEWFQVCDTDDEEPH